MSSISYFAFHCNILASWLVCSVRQAVCCYIFFGLFLSSVCLFVVIFLVWHRNQLISNIFKDLFKMQTDIPFGEIENSISNLRFCKCAQRTRMKQKATKFIFKCLCVYVDMDWKQLWQRICLLVLKTSNLDVVKWRVNMCKVFDSSARKKKKRTRTFSWA